MTHDIPDDWHHEFFGGLWLEVQRQSFTSEDNAEIAETISDGGLVRGGSSPSTATT